MSMSTGPYAAAYTQQLTATRRAYEALKGLLLSGDVPVGHRLREERIAERGGVSRTPVRDAMHQLSGEGFLERRRDGGIYVVTPSVVVMGELYDVRRALELCTLRLAVRRGLQYDRAALGKLRNEWIDLNADEDTRDAEFVLLDEDFMRGSPSPGAIARSSMSSPRSASGSAPSAATTSSHQGASRPRSKSTWRSSRQRWQASTSMPLTASSGTSPSRRRS